MKGTKEKLLGALSKMDDGTNEAEVVLTYAEAKEFLLVIELYEIETKLRFDKLKDAHARSKSMKS